MRIRNQKKLVLGIAAGAAVIGLFYACAARPGPRQPNPLTGDAVSRVYVSPGVHAYDSFIAGGFSGQETGVGSSVPFRL